jgi:hypothetical protein
MQGWRVTGKANDDREIPEEHPERERVFLKSNLTAGAPLFFEGIGSGRQFFGEWSIVHSPWMDYQRWTKDH